MGCVASLSVKTLVEWHQLVRTETMPSEFMRLRGLLWNIDKNNGVVAFNDWHYLAGMMNKEVKEMINSDAVRIKFEWNKDVEIGHSILIKASIKNLEEFDNVIEKYSNIPKDLIDNDDRYHMLDRVLKAFYMSAQILWTDYARLLKERNVAMQLKTFIPLLEQKEITEIKGYAKRTLGSLKEHRFVLDKMEYGVPHWSLARNYKDFLCDEIKDLLGYGGVGFDVKIDRENSSIEVTTYIMHARAFLDYAGRIGLGGEDVEGILESVANEIANAYYLWGLSLKRDELLRQ